MRAVVLLIEKEPDAVIKLCDMEFRVWLSGGGITRLELPGVGQYMETCRNLPAAVRIDIRKETAAPAERIVESAAVFLEDFLTGKPPRETPPADLESASHFTGDVLRAVEEIPWGETRSYAWVASYLEKPAAARAVGSAVARNPVPLLVPCHRVVRSDGGTGGWSGAPGWKEVLLQLEAGLGRPAGRQNREDALWRS